MSAFKCPNCATAVKWWKGDDPKCGFTEDGAFTSDNWNCDTLVRLRGLMEQAAENRGASRYGFAFRDDCGAGSAGMLWVPESGNRDTPGDGFFVVLSWYKSKGCTNGASYVDDELHRPLTMDEAVRALRQCAKMLGGEKNR